MKFVKKTLVMTVAAASIAIGAMGSARADAFAQSILVIDNFRLLHSNGVAFNVTDFGFLDGTNNAHATAELNGVFANGADSLGILSGSTPDVAQQSVGFPSPPLAENDFTPFPSAPPVPGTFGYADQNLTGSSIEIGMAPAGARAETRADASLAMDGVASGISKVGTSTTFKFALTDGDTMTVVFDATPFLQAYVSADTSGNGSASAYASLAWSINIVNLTTDDVVFDFAPDFNVTPNAPFSLNAARSRSASVPGTLTYNPGTLSFSATTPFLNTTDSYELTIQHNTSANAAQATTAIPEPATLAIFGLGLLGMSAFGRRKS